MKSFLQVMPNCEADILTTADILFHKEFVSLRQLSVAVVPDGLSHLLLLVDQSLFALHDLLQVGHFHLGKQRYYKVGPV